MKTLMMGAFALVAVSFASAASTIRITGSTAFRQATHVAIGNILQAGYTVGYSGTSLNSAGQAIFTGTTAVGNIPVIIKTAWAGSTGGVKTIAQISPVITVDKWLVDGTPAGPSAPANYDAPTAADIAMSDSFQGSSPYIGTGYTTLVDKVVGVVTFVFVRGAGTPTTLDNMTQQLAINLFNGGLPLSQFTNDPADADTAVYGLGRDEDSGTRVNAFAEPGFGVQSTPVQYQPTISAGTVTAVNPWPANTLLGETFPVGHSGYASGGTLCTDLNNPPASGAGFVLVGYAGINDAAKTTNGAPMKYNGVAYSEDAVRNGEYSFWGYEHLMYRPTLGGDAKTVADQIAKQIHDTDAAQSGVVLSTMNVGKAVEGGPITFGNPY